jgi:magnesium transporter
MIKYYFRTIKDAELKEVEDLRTGTWIHAVSPSNKDLADIFEKLALDKDLIEDVQDFYEVPRFERTGGVMYFFTRYPIGGNGGKREGADTAPMAIIMGESFVFTIVQRENAPLKDFLSGKEVVHTTQKTKLFIQLMQAVTKAYEKQLVVLRRNVNKDRAQLRKIGNREIERFVTYEHMLNDMISAIVPTNTALQQVTKGNYIQMFSDDVEMMEDLVIDNSQLLDSARSVLKTIQNVRSATEAILANNLNTTIKTLTVLTILLTIPTIVASIFGMNVLLPLQHSPHAFWAVVGIILASVSFVVWYFRKNEWL